MAITARDASEALTCLDLQPVDVVVLDIGLPDVDGYELLRRIRERPSDRNGTVPAAALTAYARVADRTRSLQGGFQMHIGPPNNEAGGADVAANLKRFSELGLEVLISEMDINRCSGQVTEQEQLTYYHDIVEACFKLPKCAGITFWGINDGRSWLNGWPGALCNNQSSQALLFDDQYQRKATYQQVMKALLGQ